MLADALRKASDEALRAPLSDPLADLLDDLGTAVVDAQDAARTYADSAAGDERTEARAELAAAADNLLVELAAAGLVAPRLGTATATGRELALDRLTKVARQAVRAIEDTSRLNYRTPVEAVLVATGYLPPART